MSGLSLATANLRAAIGLLLQLQQLGLQHVVLCPGSRSAPLALAAGGLAERGLLDLVTAIDERSAGFHALGVAAASGRPVAVITTSGTAVANLLPAAVEADRSSIPLLFLTGDRPQRLKNCGANQTVNQEDFLASACRWMATGPVDGLHGLPVEELRSLTAQAWERTLQTPGPVHLNLPFEEPLHPSAEQQQQLWTDMAMPSDARVPLSRPADIPPRSDVLRSPDWTRPGVVVAGPWRGLAADLPAYQQALQELVECSGWPLLADPLAAVPHQLPGLIRHWDLLLPTGLGHQGDSLQVLRLGPLPASRRLEAWLRLQGSGQWLITEGDARCLDPLGLSHQDSQGLVRWWQANRADARLAPQRSADLLRGWQQADLSIHTTLQSLLPSAGAISEPALMTALPGCLPKRLPVMLAASSPVRDWQAFAAADIGARRCYSFRGASGIDGTLSLALGLARVLGPTLLISGDLALQHDSNGWLLASASVLPLVVLLIDNGGGGIFGQLPIPVASPAAFDQLFAMPQRCDPLALAAAHGVPGRQISCLEDLPAALEWGLAQQSTVLLRVCTNRVDDAELRRHWRDALIKGSARGGTTDG